ncbi:T9SS type A sorting domain-containing protein [Flavobacterium silvisoli]|uniref:T9SS type A sorting domain-containing protein n=1 Tax=Flavobacterium silvisoli TaxID=2529433 RepID=A0A4Q9YY23_9FLAO|nr:T9SS type A sorting domain-containing protein [Flavobacterium silvisoli]TBX66997.1 T9SS type A sorting domain-containing protein [Flavobacterium silvisoli]
MIKKLIFITALALSSFIAKAQVSDYSFQDNGSSFPYLSASGAPVTEHIVNDDVVSPAVVSLPFTFKFGGVNQNSLGISENGFVWFGPAQPNEVSLTNPLTNSQLDLVQGIISAAGIDLHPINTNLAQTKISTAVLGQAPNRVFVVEWYGTARIETIDDPTKTDIIDFQIRLSETTNKVDIVYGRTILNANFTSYLEVGLKTTDVDFNTRTTVNTLWSATLRGTVIDEKCKLSTLSKPAFGQRFSWTANTLSSADFDLNKVVVYPVPATTALTVQGWPNTGFEYVIFDMSGRNMLQGNTEQNTLSVDSLAAGHYVISIKSGDLALHRKFVKIQ